MNMEDSNYMHQDSSGSSIHVQYTRIIITSFYVHTHYNSFFTLFLSCIGSLFLFLFDEEFLKDHLGHQLMRTNPCSFYLNINRLETTVFTFLLSNQLFSKPIGLSLENLKFEDDLLTTCFFGPQKYSVKFYNYNTFLYCILKLILYSTHSSKQFFCRNHQSLFILK